MTTDTKKTKGKSTPKQGDSFEWHLVDLSKAPLGRLATEISSLLLGKHRTDSAKNKVANVRVVAINSDSIVVTGKKRQNKMYRRYTGYPGGLRERTMNELMDLDSRKVIQSAVSGMLPKNNLRAERMRGLKVYKTSEHPHTQVGGNA